LDASAGITLAIRDEFNLRVFFYKPVKIKKKHYIFEKAYYMVFDGYTRFKITMNCYFYFIFISPFVKNFSLITF